MKGEDKSVLSFTFPKLASPLIFCYQHTVLKSRRAVKKWSDNIRRLPIGYLPSYSLFFAQNSYPVFVQAYKLYYKFGKWPEKNALPIPTLWRGHYSDRLMNWAKLCCPVKSEFVHFADFIRHPITFLREILNQLIEGGSFRSSRE